VSESEKRDASLPLLTALQAAVAASKTDRQRATTLHERALFLSTEVGEALKEVLVLCGVYGKDAIESGRAHLATELCDVIWNACDLATLAGIDLGESMQALLEKNSKRTWAK